MIEDHRYIGNITQNINKLTKYMKEQNKNSLEFESLLHKFRKHLHKIQTVSDSSIELTNDQRELEQI